MDVTFGRRFTNFTELKSSSMRDSNEPKTAAMFAAKNEQDEKSTSKWPNSKSCVALAIPARASKPDWSLDMDGIGWIIAVAKHSP